MNTSQCNGHEKALNVLADQIPATLQAGKQHVVWRYTIRDGKPTKPPYDARSGALARSNDGDTWSTFDQSVAACRNGRGWDGIGRMFAPSDTVAGIDYDKCRDPESGVVDPLVLADVRRLDSYTEISPSGTGLRVYVHGEIPRGRNWRNLHIEVYDRGSNRFLTLTGHHLEGTSASVEDRRDIIARLYREWDERDTQAKERKRSHQSTGIILHAETDDELIRRMMDATNGAKVRALWAGDWQSVGEYPSQSEADAALCEILAFHTNGNRSRIARLFGRSGLYRQKWDRVDYQTRTIDYAIDQWRRHDGRRSDEQHHADDEPPEEPAPVETCTLAQAVETFHRWLYLEDDGLIYAVLGAVAANYAAGDPVWLMIVGASSSGKTEVLNAVAGLPNVHLAATMTESALLSGTPKREAASGAKGGLLRTIGDFGIICAKDFTSILSMARDPRTSLLAALREIYDGSWDRHIGVDGGRTLSWRGKIGMVAGCTAAWDAHHAVVSAMGERFLIHRPPEVNPRKQARKELANTGREAQMRRELAGAVQGLFAGLEIPDDPPALSEAETERLIALGSLVARCRSAVERDGRSREIELILDAEAPARITQALRRLYGGLRIIGLDLALAWQTVIKTGLDCMPKVRRAVFEVLVDRDKPTATSEIALAVGYPTNTARRALEDLAVHRIAERRGGGKGKSDTWHLSRWARAQYEAACVPEMSGDAQRDDTDRTDGDGLNNPHRMHDDFSGTPPAEEPSVAAGWTEFDRDDADGDERVTSCWGCKLPISTESNDLCSACGWIRCNCGACERGCTENGDETTGCRECGEPVLSRGLCKSCLADAIVMEQATP